MLLILVAISQKSCCRKEAWAIQKLFIKKEKKKWTQKYLRYIKQWVLRCLPEKRKKKEKKRREE
jgi:hypothetical protein